MFRGMADLAPKVRSYVSNAAIEAPSSSSTDPEKPSASTAGLGTKVH